MRDMLVSKRFFPLFWTQFFGAFNDNVFKNALAILVIYKSYSLGPLDPKLMVSLAAGIFIFPFFIFSATAGQIADKYSKSKIALLVKVWELFAMIFGAAGFMLDNVPLLLMTLFFMGMQSAFFGPVKYSILPELLETDELMKGNAYIEMGTFIAIPAGTIVGAFAIDAGEFGPLLTSIFVLGFALIGISASFFIPHKDAVAPKSKVNYNLVSATFQVLKRSSKYQSIFLSIIAISWFWVIGAIFLTVIPQYGKEFLNGKVEVVTLLLVLFSVGIGVGSIVCEKISQGRLELGVLPVGAIGMTIFCIDLFVVGKPSVLHGSVLIGALDLIQIGAGFRVVFDFFMLAFFGGIFIVPLYTLIQMRAKVDERAQMIAANNIWNALFMVVASIGLMLLFSIGLDVSQIFLIVGILNIVVVVAVYFAVPEFFFRFMAWIVTSVMYRAKTKGLNQIPLNGACVYVANHVSFVDWMLIMSVSPRPVRFVMYKDFFKIPFMGKAFKRAGIISISSPVEDRADFIQSFERISKALQNDEAVCIFPEGEITYNGELGEFKRGIEKIISRDPVPVIPIAIDGMWGSFFSRKYGKAMTRPFKRVWSRIRITVGNPFEPSTVTATGLREEVQTLLDSGENNS